MVNKELVADAKEKLLVIDSHALLHRAFHALPPLTNKKGELVGATFGFFSIFLSAIKETSPRWIATCFDSSAPTFRHKAFIGYQAKRPPMVRGLLGQIAKTREILKMAGLPVFIKPGFEADDLMATLARKFRKKANSIFILTGDKDLMQLVDSKVNLLLLQRQMSRFLRVTPRVVKEKLGVEPSRVVDLKALMGDTSDNYPGVPGIGPKTALRLLKKHDSFKKIYRNIDKLPGNLKKKLGDGEEAGKLSMDLAKVADRVPIKVSFNKMGWQKSNVERLRDILKQEGFISLTRRIEKYLGSEEKIKQQKLFSR